MTCVSSLKKKYEAFEMFQVFKKEVENETELRIKCLRYNNGGEFTSREFQKLYKKEGIKREYLAVRTPQ